MKLQDGMRQLRALIKKELILRVTKPSFDQGRLTIKAAAEADAKLVKKWIAARPEEAAFIGAKGKTLNVPEITEWISNSAGAYVLYEDQQPRAFANITPKDGDFSQLEVGRLLVDPDRRRRGLGSTLVRNICLALSAAYKELDLLDQNMTLSRVVRTNEVGHSFIKTLPFSKLNEEHETWYQYYLDRRRSTLFRQTLENLRKELGMSQAMLAFRCGVQRATINMIERGTRVPSVELLRSICRVLSPDDQYNRVRMLLAFIGEHPEETLRSYPTVATLNLVALQNVWVATDTLAENEIDSYFDDTKEAISSGYDRVFFMPEGQWKQGESVKSKLENELSSKLKANIGKHFRFYEAPEGICCCRVVIENPESEQRKVTVGGERLTRMPLSVPQAFVLHRILSTGMVGADAIADQGRDDFVKGFRRRFPVRKDQLR